MYEWILLDKFFIHRFLIAIYSICSISMNNAHLLHHLLDTLASYGFHVDWAMYQCGRVCLWMKENCVLLDNKNVRAFKKKKRKKIDWSDDFFNLSTSIVYHSPKNSPSTLNALIDWIDCVGRWLNKYFRCDFIQICILCRVKFTWEKILVRSQSNGEMDCCIGRVNRDRLW